MNFLEPRQDIHLLPVGEMGEVDVGVMVSCRETVSAALDHRHSNKLGQSVSPEAVVRRKADKPGVAADLELDNSVRVAGVNKTFCACRKAAYDKGFAPVRNEPGVVPFQRWMVHTSYLLRHSHLLKVEYGNYR